MISLSLSLFFTLSLSHSLFFIRLITLSLFQTENFTPYKSSAVCVCVCVTFIHRMWEINSILYLIQIVWIEGEKHFFNFISRYCVLRSCFYYYKSLFSSPLLLNWNYRLYAIFYKLLLYNNNIFPSIFSSHYSSEALNK